VVSLFAQGSAYPIYQQPFAMRNTTDGVPIIPGLSRMAAVE
jgi:hypothetical protein